MPNPTAIELALDLAVFSEVTIAVRSERRSGAPQNEKRPQQRSVLRRLALQRDRIHGFTRPGALSSRHGHGYNPQ